MTIIANRLAELASLNLQSGIHSPDSGQMCVMEAVAYVAGEEWSDHPECVSEVIGAFMRKWNDALDDDGRQKLKPYIPCLVGSKASKAVESKRAWLCTDWLIHHQAPAWLDLAGCHEQAEVLRGLPPILTSALAKKSQPFLEEARTKATAARAAAWAAAAGAAAWAAAARAAAGAAAGAAAWAAARKKLAPTVVSLQQSAFNLLDEMLELR